MSDAREQDFQWLVDRKTRVTTRTLAALVLGAVANWQWLLGLTLAWGIGEFLTVKKARLALHPGRYSPDPEERGKAIGHAIGFAVPLAAIGTIMVAVIATGVKLLKMWLFS